MKLAAASSIFGLIALTNAQYQGQIFAVPEGECPDGQSDETKMTFSWSGSWCEPISNDLCPDGNCGLLVDAVYTGLSAVTPSKFKACNDAQCGDCPHEYDIEEKTNAFSVECANFDGQGYMYLG